jgi:hypothetical protein
MHEAIGFALILFAGCGVLAVGIYYDLKAKAE